LGISRKKSDPRKAKQIKTVSDRAKIVRAILTLFLQSLLSIRPPSVNLQWSSELLKFVASDSRGSG